MTIEAKQVPLYEQLEDVPIDARLVIDDSDGMGATILAIGRMCHGAAAALRAAIEQAEKPWVKTYTGGTPHYTTPDEQPRQWQGLTDEEIYLNTNNIDRGERGWAVKFARSIEAKLREKNNG